MLLSALCHDDGASLPRLRKQTGLSMSSLLRSATALQGLGLIERRESGGRDCLFLTDKGRVLCPRP